MKVKSDHRSNFFSNLSNWKELGTNADICKRQTAFLFFIFVLGASKKSRGEI